ncbi:carboxymuconolactone decarboxylase family protein [Nocardia carnea]|uniref:carboxymuconolactone decarboxylase family protein n=1 Tax=Nocardia carnea TaxID=37328 RepID=UPI00245514C6|nr:carboxymuconolactone decarboxylase family protein [Nocardia carnea]
MSVPRIPPRPTADWTSEVDKAFSGLHTATASEPNPSRPEANILGIYAWHPALIRGWMPFSSHLRNSTLSDRVREIAIIRTTWLGFGEYEWAQHVRICRAGGYLTDPELEALTVGPEAAHWSVEDAALVRAVDELCTAKTFTDTTWAHLERTMTREQVLDFVFTVGTYDMHCTVFNAIGLELEPGITGFPPGHRPPERPGAEPGAAPH